MNPKIKKIAMVLAGVLGLGVFAMWLVLSSPFFSHPRSTLTARILSEKLGRTIEITGDVRVELGATLRVSATGLSLPSQDMPETNLSTLERLEFNVDLGSLISGRVDVSEVRIDGAKVALIVEENGTSSWSFAESATNLSPNEPEGNAKMVAFLSDGKVQFVNASVLYQDGRNGLDFELLLDSLNVSKDQDTSPVTIAAKGTLNNEHLSVDGLFSPDHTFTANAVFEQMSVALTGLLGPKYISTSLKADVADVQQLLDVLKLKAPVSGIGHATVDLEYADGSVTGSNLDVGVFLEDGKSLTMVGDLGQLRNTKDDNFTTKINWFGEDNLPPAAKVRQDLKLTSVTWQRIALDDGDLRRQMTVETNGFVAQTRKEGQPSISFSGISRTPDGLLRIGKVAFRFGPTESRYFTGEGSVGDAIHLKDADFDTHISIPAVTLLAPQNLPNAGLLGAVSGGFRVQGGLERLALSELDVFSENTDLWALKVGGSVGNAMNFTDIDLEIATDVPSGADLLKALGLKPVATGPVELATRLSSHGSIWQSAATISVGDSQLAITTELDQDDPTLTAHGKIEGDVIRVKHLRSIGAAALQLRNLYDLERQKIDEADEKTLQIQPLVLNQPVPEESSETTSMPDVRDLTLQPLTQEILLSGANFEGSINIQKIIGDKESTSLTSELEVKDKKFKIGPAKFTYGPAHFDVTGAMDLDPDATHVSLSGSAGGWDLGQILRELKFEKAVTGLLFANFNVSGSRASLAQFVKTLNGSATVSLKDGSVDSQLLDLAGLGIIPWLFSSHKEKVATIVCARAPLTFSNGHITTKQTVVETKQVQIVVYGEVDTKSETLEIYGQPRRIGEPLARSPWPFTAIGPIKKPDIKINDGPKKFGRADGADQMPQNRKPCVPDIFQLQ